MKKTFTTILIAVFVLVGLIQQVGAQTSQLYGTPIASTVANPVWFFIQNPGSGRVLELSASGTNTLSDAVPLTTNNDLQLWQFVQSGSTYTLINKGRAGTFDASFAWDNSSTEAFTITAGFAAGKYAIKSSTNNYLVDATAAGGNVSFSATVPTVNAGNWYFVNAPTSSTSSSPIWYQWSSLRTFGGIHTLSSSILKWTATLDLTSDNSQYWRFEATTNGYKISNRTESTNFLYMSGTIGTANNTTSSSSNATTFVLSPRANATGSLFIYAQGTVYNATDYNGDGTMGLYYKSTLPTADNQHHKFFGFSNVAAPTINTPAGSYPSTQVVNVTLPSSESAYIAYTTDGTDPNVSKTRTISTTLNAANVTLINIFTSAITRTVKACAYKPGFFSTVASSVYTQAASVDWCYIQFSNGNNVLEDKGAGTNLLTAAKSGTDAQLWKVDEVSPGSNTFILTSKLGNKMNFASSRYNSNATTGVSVAFDKTSNTTYANSFELRQSVNLATGIHMNQNGGAGVGKELAEYNFGDGGNCLLITPVSLVQSSTASSPIWYLIKNTGRGGKGGTLQTNGFNAQMKCTTAANTVAADGTSTDAAAPSLTQLFRFEETQVGGPYRIVNAALPNGEVLQTGINYGTATTPATTWKLNSLGYSATLLVNEINIIASGNSASMHDDASNNLVAWAGGVGSASSWYVETYTGNTSTLYQTQYDALTTQYNTLVDGSGNSVSPYSVGTKAGNYDATKFQAVKDAFAAMVSEKNTNGVTSENMIQKFTDLTVALAAFKVSQNLPTVSTTGNDTWYYIKAQRGVAAPFYFTAHSDSSRITGEAGNATYYQLWKVVANGSGFALQCRADNSYLNFDADPFATKATIPTKTFAIYPSQYLASAFHIYGSGYTIHAGNAGLQNYGVLSDNCSYIFTEYDPSQVLSNGITEAIATVTSSPLGTNPGQFKQSDSTSFQTAIQAAVVVRDKVPAATFAEFETAIADLGSAKSTFWGAANAIKFGTWYVINNPNKGNKYLSDNGLDSLVTGTDLVAHQDKLLWKFKDAGTGMVNIVSKVNNGYFKPAAYNTALSLTLDSVNLTMKLVGQGQYSILHKTTSAAYYMDDNLNIILSTNSGGLNTNGAWTLQEVPQVSNELTTGLNTSMTNATTQLANTVAGTNPGQYPTAARTALQTALTTAQGVYDNAFSNSDEYGTATTNLNAAVTAYTNSAVKLVQSSTDTTPVWYLIKNIARGGRGATIFTNGLNAQMRCTTAANTVAADGTSTGAAAPSLTQLFRFEAQTDGSYRIVNAAMPTGEVLQAGSGGDSGEGINYGTATTPSTTWNLNYLGNSATPVVFEATIVSTGNSTMMHDEGNTNNNLVSWNTGIDDASAWYFEQYTGDVNALFQSQYDVLTAQYGTIADGSGNAVSPFVVGTKAGNFDAAKFQAVKDAYAAMVTEKTTNGVTSATMIQKFTDLTVAIAAFKVSQNLPTVSTTGNDTWYYIKAQRGAAPFIFTAHSNNSRITCEAGNATNYQLWKVVANGSGYALQSRADSSYLDYDADLFGTKAAMPTKNFGIYPSSYVTSAFHLYGSDKTVHAGNGGLQNYGDLSDNCSFVFEEYNAAQVLSNGITEATTIVATSPVGTNPGFFKQSDIDNFQTGINAAIVERDKVPAATMTELESAMTALGTAKSTFWATANAIKFGTWYVINNPNKGNKSLTDNGLDSLVTGTDLVAHQDKLLWKFKDAGTGLVNIVSNVSKGYFKPAAYNTALSLKLDSVNLTMKLVGQGQFSMLHKTTSYAYCMNDDLNIILSSTISGGLNTTGAWSLQEIPQVTNELIAALSTSMTNATTQLANTTAGTNPGQYSTTARTALQTALSAAQGVYDNVFSITDDYSTATTNLNAALTTYDKSLFLLVNASTATEPIWYLIKNTTRGGKGGTLYSNGLNAQMKCTTAANTVAADGTSTGAAAPSLTQLFRFEGTTVGGPYRIVNAALPTGEALQAASGGSSGNVIKYGTATTPSTTWNLNFLGNSNAVNQIGFVSTGNSTMMHDDGTNNLVSWNTGINDNSAWYVEQFTGNVNALFQVQYDALTTQYKTIVDSIGNPVAPYTLGTQPGQFGTSTFQAVKDAYTAMVAEKNTNGITSQNMISKFTNLTSAIAAFTASKVAPVAFGGTIDAAATYTLKLVQTGSGNDGMYLKNPRIDANNGTDGIRPYATFTTSIDSTTLWKFVASTTAGKYILCSTRKTKEYLDEEGRVRDAVGYGDNSWTTKALFQNTLAYDATSLLIVKIDQNSNYYTVGTTSAATLTRNASNWATFKLEPYVLVGMRETKENRSVAIVTNGVIHVSNTDNFSVYTLTGTKVRNENLKTGVYFVKTENQTLKVSVQ